jgi:type IV secretion system protein VirB10
MFCIDPGSSGGLPGQPQAADSKPPLDPGSMQNMQDRKLAFANAETDKRTISPDRLSRPTSRYIVQAGSVIPAALITGIRSDLPGEITAQITENVYDSRSGKFLLIPQGARLIGQYDSQISFGQSRVLLVWGRVIMPNGSSVVLEHQQGADSAGYAGLEDDVDYHWGNLLKAAAISTVLGISSELVLNSNNAVVQALRSGAENTVNQTGQTLVSRQLNVQPTLTIRPGFPVRVVVNRDLIFVPYKG